MPLWIWALVAGIVVFAYTIKTRENIYIAIIAALQQKFYFRVIYTSLGMIAIPAIAVYILLLILRLFARSVLF